jgi:DNA-binding transcriptional regulator YiaG
MKTKTQPFAIHIPDANEERAEKIVTIDVPVRWDEMIDEWVLTEEAHEMIESRKALEMGLLSPEQLRELRERHGLNQKQMGQLFQVGEKSWNRWESGKHRPTRSINLLIRALHDGEISMHYLRERAGMPVEKASPAASEFIWSAIRSSQEIRHVPLSARILSGSAVKVGSRTYRPSNSIKRGVRKVSSAPKKHEFDLYFVNAS